MKKSKIFIVSNGIYPFDIMVALGATHDEVLKRIKKTGYKLNQEEISALKIDSPGRTTRLLGD